MSDFELNGDILVKWNSKKREAIVPSGVRVVGQGAFNSYVKQFRLPEGVEIIEKDAFDGLCGATIYLPKSIKEIKARAFEYFYSDTNVVYAGDAETFKQINIATSGNREFIKRMESQLGLESRFPPKAPPKPRITKKQIREYADNLAKQFNVERVDKENLGLDMWHNVILETKGLFSVKDNLINIAVSNEFLKIDDWLEQLKFKNRLVTIESAKRLGKMQFKKAMDEHCKGVLLNYQGDAEKDARKILSQNIEPKWRRIYATSYRELPIEMMKPSGELSTNNPPKFEDGKYVIELDRSDCGSTHYMLSDEQLSKNGCIIVPLRLRIISDSVPTEENVYAIQWDSYKGKYAPIPLSEEYVCESCEHNYKHYFYYDFYIGDIKHEFCIMLIDRSGLSSILEYKIGKDDEGYYIDALFKMDYCLWNCY